jgi:hypothetical protein
MTSHKDTPLYATDTLDKVHGEPNLVDINKAVTQLAGILSAQHCEAVQSQQHGYAWIILNDAQWLLRNGVTVPVPVPTHPGNYEGTTHAHKFKYEADVNKYQLYHKHLLGTIQMLHLIFDNEVFLDLQDDQGQVIGHTPKDIIAHIITSYVIDSDYNDIINDEYETMRGPYDPSKMANTYFHMLQAGKRQLAAVKETVTDATLIRLALKQFSLHIDLHEAVEDWTDLPRADRTTWAQFKPFFQKAIKKTKKGTGKFSQLGIANAAIQEHMDDNKEHQIAISEVILKQQQDIKDMTAIISALTTNPKPQANAATQPPAPPPAPDPNAQMLATLQTMLAKLNETGKGKDTHSRPPQASRQNDNNAQGLRTRRRYNHNNYCWTCGFDVGHTSDTCKWSTNCPDHKKLATVTNRMGGSERNTHLIGKTKAD